MTASTARPLLTPEEIAVSAGEQAPFIRYAERALVFGEREMRLRQLSPGHAMGDYLGFVAEIARAQAAVLTQPIEAMLPTAEQAGDAARAGRPLLPAAGAADVGAYDWRAGGAWRAVQRRLLAALIARLPAGPARDVARALAAAPDAHLEAQAERLLAGIMTGVDLAAAPLVGAGLQVWFTHLVLATRDAFDAAGAREAPFGRVDEETRCPCCGSLPTVGLVRIGGGEQGFRYLACSLCSTQWHMVRIKCSHCLSTKGIGYQSLRTLAEGDDAPGAAAVEGAGTSARAIQAECCSECGHYLKMLHMERDPHLEPTADDLATLTLDLLVSEGGFERQGVDLMLLFGDPEAEPATIAAEPGRP